MCDVIFILLFYSNLIIDLKIFFKMWAQWSQMACLFILYNYERLWFARSCTELRLSYITTCVYIENRVYKFSNFDGSL